MATNGSENILDSDDMKKLFVSKIPEGTTDEDLKAFLEKMCGGTITEFSVVRKEKVKWYFGFFTFENSYLVDEVISKEKELVINGGTLEVNRAVPKNTQSGSVRNRTKKLFIAGIPKTGVTEEELKDYFNTRHDPKYGTVESVQLIKVKDAEGKKLEENKGFGFITVSSEHLADTMSIQYATLEFGGNSLKLKKSDRDGQSNRGGRGGGRGGRGGGAGIMGAAPYGGYGGGYGGQWGGYGGYDNYGVYPQYGVASAAPRGRGGRGARGGARGGRGKRFTPYAK